MDIAQEMQQQEIGIAEPQLGRGRRGRRRSQEVGLEFQTPGSSTVRRANIAALTIITLTSFFLVFIPAYLIRPFVPQSARGLTIAYLLRSVSPWMTMALGLVGGLLILLSWQASRSAIARGGLSCGAVILMASAILSRQNHFEWMFSPMKTPGFVAASIAAHVSDSDMILGVRLGGEARAYPVRIMAYHHLVNDVIASQPLVVTY